MNIYRIDGAWQGRDLFVNAVMRLIAHVAGLGSGCSLKDVLRS